MREDQQQNRPKVSVIIPLYHADKFVDDLLDQLCEQPLEQIEIICVVDGSPDETPGIVEARAAQDERIRWIRQEHAGAGAARNAGLGMARGEYLAFLDVDDLYEPRFLATMFEAAQHHDADLVICQFNCTDHKTGRVIVDEGFRSDKIPVNRALSPSDLEGPFTDMSVIPHNKLFRKEVVDREHLRFSNTQVSNDIFFALAMVAASERIVALPDNLLNQRTYINPRSITSNRERHSEDVLVCFRELHAWLDERGLFDQYRNAYTGAWAKAVHYNATFKRNSRFIELTAQTLANEDPWATMGDRELSRAANLDMGLPAVKKLVASLQPITESRAIELQRLDNEAAAVREIIGILNSEYGKHLPTRPNLLAGIVTLFKRNGIRRGAAKFFRRLKRH